MVSKQWLVVRKMSFWSPVKGDRIHPASLRANRSAANPVLIVIPAKAGTSYYTKGGSLPLAAALTYVTLERSDRVQVKSFATLSAGAHAAPQRPGFIPPTAPELSSPRSHGRSGMFARRLIFFRLRATHPSCGQSLTQRTEKP